MFSAIRKKDEATVVRLLQDGKDPNIRISDTKEVKSTSRSLILFLSFPIVLFSFLASRTSSKSFGAIGSALYFGAIFLYRKILGSPDQSLWTPLHFAAYHGHGNIILRLLEYGANPELKDKYGRTPKEIIHLNPMNINPASITLETFSIKGKYDTEIGKILERTEALKVYFLLSSDVVTNKVIDIRKHSTLKSGRWARLNVAVKIFNGVLMESKNIDEFKQQISKLVLLRHPHIVSFHGAYLSPKLTIVLDLMTNNLNNLLLNKEPLSWKWKLNVSLQIAKGLSYLHAKNMIHGNISPYTIFVDHNGHIRIGAIGEAKLKELIKFDEKSDFVSPDIKILSQKRAPRFLWQAPEIFADSLIMESYGKPTQSSDIYSLGIIFWEIAARSLPWQEEINQVGKTRLQAYIAQGKQQEIPEDCPDPYKQLIENCCSLDPKKRPSVSQVLQELTIMAQPENDLTNTSQQSTRTRTLSTSISTTSSVRLKLSSSDSLWSSINSNYSTPVSIF